MPAARCRNRLLISPSKRSVVRVVEEMVTQKLVTLIVPSLVLDEFRRLGWIYPSRLIVTNRAAAVMGERISRCSLSEGDHPQRGEAMHTSGSMCPVMRRASVALLFLPLAVPVVVGQLQVGPRALPPQREIIVSTDRVDRLERWLKAVDQHEPGEIDDATSEIGRFSETALRDLWVDTQSL